MSLYSDPIVMELVTDCGPKCPYCEGSVWGYRCTATSDRDGRPGWIVDASCASCRRAVTMFWCDSAYAPTVRYVREVHETHVRSRSRSIF